MCFNWFRHVKHNPKDEMKLYLHHRVYRTYQSKNLPQFENITLDQLSLNVKIIQHWKHICAIATATAGEQAFMFTASLANFSLL